MYYIYYCGMCGSGVELSKIVYSRTRSTAKNIAVHFMPWLSCDLMLPQLVLTNQCRSEYGEYVCFISFAISSGSSIVAFSSAMYIRYGIAQSRLKWCPVW